MGFRLTDHEITEYDTLPNFSVFQGKPKMTEGIKHDELYKLEKLSPMRGNYERLNLNEWHN